MMKRKYITPEMELLILEQTDIITGSGNVSGNTKPGTDGGGDEGIFDGDWET